MQILMCGLLFLVFIVFVCLLYLVFLFGRYFINEIIIDSLSKGDYALPAIMIIMLGFAFIFLILSIFDPTMIKQDIRDDFNRIICIVKNNI